MDLHHIMTIWSFLMVEILVKTFTVVEAKSHFSALLVEIEAGEEIAITRHGKIVARMVPNHPSVAADAFRDFWSSQDDIDLQAPEDSPAETVASMDN
jgi:antitoxin (DNA-binding transcriptional repressor) of toxin-antitoxin stability system